jgi:hypothetical protein
VINYRYRPDDVSLTEAELNDLNQHLSNEIIKSRQAMLVTTVLKGKVVLRMCLINPRSTLTDITETLDSLEQYARRYLEQITP